MATYLNINSIIDGSIGESKLDSSVRAKLEKKELFFCTYNSTTYAQIQEAVNEGKYPILFYSNNMFPFLSFSEGYAHFTNCYEGDAYHFKCSQSNSTWSYSAYKLETSSNKVNSISSSSTNDQYPSAKCVYDIITNKANIVKELNSLPSSGGLLPNTLYNLGTLTSSTTLSISLASGTSGERNEYMLTFNTGASAPTIGWPSGVTWDDDNQPVPTIEANKHYEISILNGYGFCKSISIS